MAVRQNWALHVAQSEMSRRALNSWDKFKLPAPNTDINAVLEKLQAAPRRSRKG